MLTSACVVQCTGHIGVTDKTLVKSSKVGTIMPRDCHAKWQVTVQLSLVLMATLASEQQVASGFVPQGMVLQRPNEVARVAIMVNTNSR